MLPSGRSEGFTLGRSRGSSPDRIAALTVRRSMATLIASGQLNDVDPLAWLSATMLARNIADTPVEPAGRACCRGTGHR